MNDRIGSAFWTQKTHVNYLDTFKAPEPGYLGGLFNNEPFYYYDAATPKCESLALQCALLVAHALLRVPTTDKVKFDVTNVTSLPKVDIVYGHQETDGRLLDAIVKFGDVKGIVLASKHCASIRSRSCSR